MQCPFCREEVGSEDDLQLHCLVCSSAYAEPGSAPRPPRVDSVVVRFRWVKSRPCFDREVHLISSLAGSVKLHWKEDEGLYESDAVGVPVGPHICQLAVGGDVVPTEEFEVNEDSDVIFIILQEANYGYMTFDDDNRRARIRTDDISSDGEPELPVDTHDRPPHPLDMESRENQTDSANEMSPLYRELLQHQLSHGEPSWVPGSGVQSPVMSDVDLSALAGRQDDDDDEPPILTPQPDSIEEQQPSSPVPLHPGLEADSRPGDLSGESDGIPSLPDGGDVGDQSENEAEEVLSSTRPPAPPSSASPVPSSHSEHDSRVSSRDSPVNSVPSEAGGRDDSVISPLLDEALRHDSPPPITESPFTEGEHTNVVPRYTSPQATPGRDHASTEEREHVPSTVQTTAEEHPTEHAQFSPRASPLGSVLDAVTAPVTDANVVTSTPDALASDHEATSPPERHSPAGSVHSSSLFSSGLPTPIMSPRGCSQSDTGMPLTSRGSPLGSIHIQTQLPLRPQSLGGSVNLSERAPAMDLLTTLNSASHLESRRGPVSGAEESPVSPVLRQSPTGSNHSTSVHPQRESDLAGDASRHSSQRSTPLLSAHGGPPPAASPFVAPPRTLPLSHEVSGNSTPSVHSPRHRTSGAGSPTELLMETVYRQATDVPPVASRDGSAAATPPVMPQTSSRVSHRDSENSTPSVPSPRHRTSGPGSPSDLLAETAFRQGTPPVASRNGSAAATPVMPPTSARVSHRESENNTPLVHSPRHRTSGAGSPSELLAETVHRRGTPPVSSHGGSSRVSRGQSPASSVRSRAEHSSPRILSPPLLHESVIPSRESAFATVNGERGPSVMELSSELEALRQERDTLANELRRRAAHYESELRRVKSRNEDLEQQMLSIETVATLTKQDDEKTQELEQKVLDLNRALQEKDEEAHSLQESVRRLERTNQQLKEEQESLKTVNQLRLEDMNKLNSDLQQELSDLQRRSLDSTRAEGKIIELKVLQKTLEQHVRRLERENERLQTKLKQAEQEIDTMKAITRRTGTRLSKAKSETDLSKKFDKYTSYDKHKYGDYEPTKAVSFAVRGEGLGLGTTRFSSSDTNYTRSHDVGVSSPVIMNGYSSPRSEVKRLPSSYTSLQDRLSRDPPRSMTTVPRHRVGSLGEDSDVSDDLEHGLGYYTGTQPRWRTQSSESSTSSVVSWDHDYSADAAARQPRASAYNPSSSLHQEDDRVGGRRRRPHSYHGASGSLNDVFGSKDEYTSSYHVKSSPYSHSLRDVGQHSTSSSSYSTDSQSLTTTPYHSAVATSHTSTKLLTKPFAPTSSSDIQLGMEVLVTRSRGQIGRGIVKYVGPLPGRKEMYIGIELRPGQGELTFVTSACIPSFFVWACRW
ncbi:uncharacterized protein LOC144658931 isoform X2 [Oculina patagonica]